MGSITKIHGLQSLVLDIVRNVFYKIYLIYNNKIKRDCYLDDLKFYIVFIFYNNDSQDKVIKQHN